MKNFDLISRRIAVVGITLCAVLLCATLLVLVSTRSAGQDNENPPQQYTYRLYPMGVSDGYVYYIYDNGGPWTFEKIAVSKAVNESWVK
ncbi:MAG TPA: hypothetical protein PKN48_11515 [Bacteroidales bacterium]|nr:hypothetical protein [Bacteroidales bacterium]